MDYYEVNFDGMPGPTHLFAGLSHGNIASTSNEGQVSNPKAAALQSLEKMKFLYKLGIKQAFIPPQKRPYTLALQAYGFKGSRSEMLKKALDKDPKIFKDVTSSSNMWTANAATVSPSPDSKDKKVHLTVANLFSNKHRSYEAQDTLKYFRQVFPGEEFSLHGPLASHLHDEGAANHTRLCSDYGKPGLEFFVYGKSQNSQSLPEKFPARQSLGACESIIDLHSLSQENTVLAQQNPEAIDAGVFHNDVISTGNKDFFIYHEKAFLDSSKVVEELNAKFKKTNNKDLSLVEVKNNEVSLQDAVSSYLFNSQIISTMPGNMVLITPSECQSNIKVKKYIDKLLNDPSNPIKKVHYMNLNESMRNGGGPACLRLRVVLSNDELKASKQTVLFNEELEQNLKAWIEKFYPDQLSVENLLDEGFLSNIDQAYKELSELLELRL